MNISMYVGFSELVKSRGITEAAKYAASVGFSSVELLEFVDSESYPLTFQGTEDASEASKILKSHGLSVSCLSVCANVVDIFAQEPTASRTVIERLKKCADIAAALECPYLHHTLISHLRLPENAPSYESILPLVLDAAEEVANYCLPLGITCLYEPQGFYFNGSCGFGCFLDRMKKNCENVGVCGDIGNLLFVDEPLLPFFERFAKDIKHVHLKDYFVNKPTASARKYFSKGGNVITDAPLGTGDIDLPACLRVLKSVGYTGAFALEYTATGENEVQAVKTLLRDNFI